MTPPEAARPAWTRAVVVFEDECRLWWLRPLKRGFRHCSVALGCPAGWVAVNPLSNRIEVTVLPVDAGFDLAAWHRAHGRLALETRPAPPPARALPWSPFTCVEAVKRILGLHAPLVVTPWQLCRFLSETEKYSLTSPSN